MHLHGLGPGSLYTAGGRRKYLTGNERDRFIVAARTYPRPTLGTLCLVLAYTGCRISEALALTPADLGLDAGLIAIRSLKKRSRTTVVREVPVPVELLQTLAHVHDLTNPEERLWPWSRAHAWLLVKELMNAARIPPGIHATPKGLRHGFGLHAIRASVPLNLVQRWLGHARMETTAIYLQALGVEEREIAARMW